MEKVGEMGIKGKRMEIVGEMVGMVENMEDGNGG